MGKIFKFEKDVDTDQIIASQYLLFPTIDEMKAHTFESLNSEFASSVRPGDFVVADENFGCGSSRGQAPSVLKALGVKAVIAKSFARIFYRNSINRNELRKGNRHKSFCNDNIFKNISFSSKDEKEESNSILPMEKIYNNSINNGNKDYKDIKYFLQKLYNSKIQKLNEEEKFEQSKKLYKKIEKMNSIKNKEEEEIKLDFIKLFTNNSLIETKKKIKTNNKNLFLKLAKRELFKMSFNKTNSLSKTNRNTSDKSTIYNPNSSINENNIKINFENNLNHLTRNRQNKKKLKVKEKEKEKENLNKDEKKLFLIKSKTSSEKTVNKNIINSYQENFPRSFSETKINKIRNNNTKYIKALSCNDLTSKYHIHNIKKNFRIINRQINKDQIFSLNNFEKLYNETKIKGLLPKTEIKYNLFYQPFKGVYGHNYFLDLLLLIALLLYLLVYV
mgnify:CR=1 FL=1